MRSTKAASVLLSLLLVLSLAVVVFAHPFVNKGGVGSGTAKGIDVVRKTANETVNNSAVLQDDDHLFVALAANERAAFTAVIHHVGNATADLQLAFVVPVGAAIIWNVAGPTVNEANAMVLLEAVNSSGTARSVGATSTDRTLTVVGVVTNSTNAGDLKLRWAQAAATAIDTIVKTNSFLQVTRF